MDKYSCLYKKSLYDLLKTQSSKIEREAGVFTLSCEKASEALNKGFARPEDVALVLHTSGTTSRPKLVPLTQAILNQADSHLDIIESSPLHFIRSSSASLPPSVIVALENVFKVPEGPTGKLQRIGLADKLTLNLQPEYVAPENPAQKGSEYA